MFMLGPLAAFAALHPILAGVGAGLLTGGVGALAANRSAAQQRAQIEGAQAQQNKLYADQLAANNASRAALDQRLAADQAAMSAPLPGTGGGGGGNSNIRRLYNQTVKTSVLGDQTQANTVRKRLLS